MMNLEGMKWFEVKEMLEGFTFVDSDNIGEEGECVVDFTNEYHEYSVIGRIVFGEEEDELIIEDEAIVYKNC